MTDDYHIQVRGRLGPEMRHALADLRPEDRGSSTRLCADDVDQAGLHGILGRLRDLALEVESLSRTDAETMD